MQGTCSFINWPNWDGVSLSKYALTDPDSLDFSDKVTKVDYAESFDKPRRWEMKHKLA